jgi:dipeptidase D
MSHEMLSLEPALVWKYFHEITQVPRPSKKEEKIIAWLENFAKEHSLDYQIDKIGNVVIRKKATSGYENKPWVALQSHMDMVCEKHNHVEIDFLNDPIEAYIDGEWVKAKGTTLGADDGIGMAAQLAILADNTIEHGPVECLFTVDEETGLTGAFGLEAGFLKSNILLNLDSEDDGEFFIGCAGGKDTLGTLKLETNPTPAGYDFFKIAVSGLKGGHSGDEIEKGLGNSNKILCRLLWQFQNELQLRIAHIDGGNLRNAIPREAYAIVGIPTANTQNLQNAISEYDNIQKKELFITDPGVQITIESHETSATVMSISLQKNLLNLIYAMPHGVIAWAQDIKGFVETSTNLASIKIDGDKIIITTSQRSSVESAKTSICNMVASVFSLAGAEFKHSDGYPGWTPNPKSKVLQVAKQSWKKLYGEEPVVRAIHAGLECGLFSEKYPQMDMISYGPTLRGVHSPDERLLIPTVKKFWDFTLEVLKNIE